MRTVDTSCAITRESNDYLDSILGHAFPVLDHGFVRVVSYMGSDNCIANAARVSYGKGTKSISDDRNLIRYLVRHLHTSPLEQAEIKLHVKMPIFVARQWIRHRMASLNEVSGRYSVMKDEFYVPEAGDLAPQSTSNKQGRSGSYDQHEIEELQTLLRSSMQTSFNDYGDLLEADLARELSRTVLPLSTYTEFYWKIDVHNLMHFLRLRIDSHAQKEIRVFAEQIAEVIKQWLPITWEAFEDYRLNAVTFSAAEIGIIRKWIAEKNIFVDDKIAAERGLSKREIDAFRDALKS